MVGTDDASVLLSNLSGEAEVASMGLVVGISQVVRGKLTRQEYLNRYGRRGPFEFELVVVGCGAATMRLKTGDRVQVDGGKGIVSIIRDKSQMGKETSR